MTCHQQVGNMSYVVIRRDTTQNIISSQAIDSPKIAKKYPRFLQNLETVRFKTQKNQRIIVG